MNPTQQVTTPTALLELHKGVIFGFTSGNGYYDSEAARTEVDRMAECGVGWVGLCVTMWMESFSSTRVFCDYRRTCNNAELERIIELIRSRGMRVMLYLCMELFDGRWRGDVRLPSPVMNMNTSTPDYAQAWFTSYTDCCLNYARIAQRTGAEMLCLGAEYDGLVAYDENWSTLVGHVRSAYTGALCFEAHAGHVGEMSDHPLLKREWFKLLDLIGFSFYRPAADRPGATKEEMRSYLKPTVAAMKHLSDLTGKPVLFTECGCRSRSGAAMFPCDFQQTGTYDGQEQANYLQAVIETFQGEPWWRGLYWWKWEEQNKPTRPQYYTDPAGEMGFELYGKPASQVYRQWQPNRPVT